MLKPEGRRAVGCIYIDDLMSGAQARPGHSHWLRLGDDPLDSLRTALQAVRADCGSVGIAARGTGCLAALAVAVQLPVERLALIEPAGLDRFPPIDTGDSPRRRRQARRMAAFVRRNLSLCVSDILLVQGRDRPACRAFACVPGRVTRLLVQGESVKSLYTNCENTLQGAVACFLQTGELPKSLAENPEMCIIYG